MSVTFAALYRSIALLRRYAAKQPTAIEQVKTVYSLYHAKGKQGTIPEETAPEPKCFCPLPGHGSRAAWNDAANTHGSIGLLLLRIHACGAYLNADLHVACFPFFRFDTIHCAHQHRKRHIDDLVTIAHSHTIKETRTLYSSCGTIDTAAYHRAMTKHTEADNRLLQRIQF